LSFFSDIKTATQAYALGLWLTDGYTTRTTWNIKLQKQDDEVLKDISKAFYKKPRDLLYDKNSSCFKGYSIKVAQQLREKIRGDKTKGLRVDFKWVPIELQPALLRGIFDGDGSIALRAERKHQVQIYICSISKEFLCDVQAFLHSHGIENNISTERRNGKSMKVPQGFSTCCNDMHRLHIGPHSEKLKLYELLYLQDNGPRILRKFDRFKQYYDNTVVRLESKKSGKP
jgi:intein/homing endonuclease